MNESTSKFHYVYILRSIPFPTQTYIGYTNDLNRRLRRHNSGKTFHTGKFCPWKIETAIALTDKHTALAFERYLKSHSGKAFARKRLMA
ncbi:GIY-YIG nuclease family protein [Puniceicoccales bacterium CK1056]|uniref:GIY-YIG nuclease family protein n=1 Tax=Oceanipulchritudo coccoides TaxID=2706888 RepID=A0A6B2M5E7_9BACT|nr:GIY-YIG nuclease family protein [Oceanipulchritudo coccoides]